MTLHWLAAFGPVVAFWLGFVLCLVTLASSVTVKGGFAPNAQGPATLALSLIVIGRGAVGLALIALALHFGSPA